MIYKTLHRKLKKTKDRATQTPLKTNNDLQNNTQKTKDQATQTPLKTNNAYTTKNNDL